MAPSAKAVDEVILGSANRAGETIEMSRMALLLAGLPAHVPG
jgi:acetyl-CoA acetyltransferase